MKRGWQTKRLGDFAATVSTGPFGSILHKSDYVDNGVPLVNPINMVDEGIVPDPSKLISESTKLRLSSYVLKEGDIVVARRGEIGRCAVIGSRESGWVCGTGSFFIRPLPTLNSQFLAHLIRSSGYREKLEQLSTGTTMKNLSNTALGDLAIAVPPLPEQQRIVALLDEAFSGLATAKANAERNLQNARALFESHLQSVFNDKKLKKIPLGDLCTGVEYGSSAKSKKEGKIPVLRMGNIQGGRFSWKDLAYTDDEEEITKYQLRYDDVLFNRTNSPELVGKTAIYKDERPAIFAGYLIRIHRKPDLLDADFLNYFLNSRVALDYGKTVVISSVNQANINGAKLKTYPIPTPPLSKQRDMVAKLHALSAETQRLESLYQQKLAALEELKKSLLHQAFTGNLECGGSPPLSQGGARPAVSSATTSRLSSPARLKLHAGILAIAHQAHVAASKEKYFGHVKAEKTAHFFETHLRQDLGRVPIQDAAGPSDFPRFKQMQAFALDQKYFTFDRPTPDSGHRLIPLENYHTLIEHTRAALGDLNPQVDDLIQRLLPMKMEQVGVTATVYAAWNNLLIDGTPFDDERIVLESRENWHPDKLKILRAKFFDAIQWLRENDMVPTGKGKRVPAKADLEN